MEQRYRVIKDEGRQSQLRDRQSRKKESFFLSKDCEMVFYYDAVSIISLQLEQGATE